MAVVRNRRTGSHQHRVYAPRAKRTDSVAFLFGGLDRLRWAVPAAEVIAVPKLLHARAPIDAREERKIRKLAGSRHASADWVMRAKMIVASWDGARTSAIAAQLGCHMQTVRERLARFNAEGLDGLGDRPG